MIKAFAILEQEDSDYKRKRKRAIKKGLPFRVNHLSWWKEELPTMEEMEEGYKNLKNHSDKVDYIITHCCCTIAM